MGPCNLLVQVEEGAEVHHAQGTGGAAHLWWGNTAAAAAVVVKVCLHRCTLWSREYACAGACYGGGEGGCFKMMQGEVGIFNVGWGSILIKFK